MSSEPNKKYRYLTKIWKEVPEKDDPFTASQCYCHGYDVYGDVIKKATWFEYVFLLFKGERPSKEQSQLMEKLAMVLANPGPREASVRAAMNGGNGGSTEAASLIAALAVGAGQYGGAEEVKRCVYSFSECGFDLEKWGKAILEPNEGYVEDIWAPFEHSPGFDPNAVGFSRKMREILRALTEVSNFECLDWLATNRESLEALTKTPVSLSFVAAAAFSDLGFEPKEAAMLYLILRLPGAAVHALEQEKLGWKNFPFYSDAILLKDDPGFQSIPDVKEFGL